jgi:hypothetical protein
LRPMLTGAGSAVTEAPSVGLPVTESISVRSQAESEITEIASHDSEKKAYRRLDDSRRERSTERFSKSGKLCGKFAFLRI